MKNKFYFVFSILVFSFIFVFWGAQAIEWGNEGTPKNPPTSGGPVCDHHEAPDGSCPPYVLQAFADGQPAQAWQGHFSAKFQGTAGFFGPGNAKVTGCLTYSPALWDGACYTLYNKNLENSFDSISAIVPMNPYDPGVSFKYWVVNVYGDESYAYDMNFSVDGRLVRIKDFSFEGATGGPITVNTGQQFVIKWDTADVYPSSPQLSWSGAINGGSGSESIALSGSKTFAAGSSAGTATITLSGVSGPSDTGYRSLSDQSISVNVTAPPQTIEWVDLDFRVKDVCNNNPVAFANVNINQDFGNGTNKTTDGEGFANFGVHKNKTIGWTVTKEGYTGKTGNVVSSTDPTLVNVTLDRNCGGPSPIAKLTVNSSGASGVLISGTWPGTTNYTVSGISSGTSGSLTAPSSSGGKDFISWSGCDTTSSRTCNITMNGDKTVIASYGGSSPPPPTCSATPSTVSVNQETTLRAQSGDGQNYIWSHDGVQFGTGKEIKKGWSSAGQKSIKVESGGRSGFCTVDVAIAVGFPEADLRCDGVATSCTVASGSNPTLSWCGSPFHDCRDADKCRLDVMAFSDPGFINPTSSWISTPYQDSPGTAGYPNKSNSVNTGVLNYPTYNRYKLTCSNSAGGSTESAVNVSVASSPLSGSITCNGSKSITVNSGAPVEIKWNSNNTTGCFISPKSGAPWNTTENGTPAPIDNPTADTTYGLNCWNNTTSSTLLDQCAVKITQQTPTNSITVITNRIDRTYCFSGPNSFCWKNSTDPANPGTTKTHTGQPLGTYTISDPDPLESGYTLVVTPSATQTMTSAGGITFTLNYQQSVGQSSSANDSCTVDVSEPPGPSAPSSVNVSEPNYCVSGPGGTVSWTYSDPAGSPQSAYQVQVDDQGSFQSPVVDSGKVGSGGNNYTMPQGVLNFGVTYRARVKAWNSDGIESGWATSASWKTPSHAYPNVNSPYQFTWSPSNPQINTAVQFTDRTLFDSASRDKQWLWTFTPGGTDSSQNPTRTFSSPGSYQVSESVRDDVMPASQYCTGPTQTINVRRAIPLWKEVAPK